MTPEQQLTAIIEAQVKGGCGHWNADNDFTITPTGHLMNSDGDYMAGNVLQILLDPAGLLSAYGTTATREQPLSPMVWLANEFAASCILKAWLSKPEGDAISAIKTAYELLPHKSDVK